MQQRAPRVMVLGLRGFPHVQGGVETHCEHLLPLLVDLGCHVEAIVRNPYLSSACGPRWRGVRYRRLPAPRSKALEAIVHTFLGVLYASLKRPDILHIQAIGPSLMVPVARLLGLRVVMTHHGPDYDRQKWGRLAKWTLRKGEAWGVRYAHHCIVISQTIRNLVTEKHGVESTLIPNGITLPELPDSRAALEMFGLEAGKYVLLVSRLVPEKRHMDLIEAFKRASLPGWKLVLVGASDHPDTYTRNVLELAHRTPGVVTTGFQTGQPLRELYTHAGVFVLPSSHEGLPIALLEALSYGLPVLASDIPANLEVGLDQSCYFKLSAVDELATKLAGAAEIHITETQRRHTRDWVVQRYNWRDIAQRTLSVYDLVFAQRPPRHGQ